MKDPFANSRITIREFIREFYSSSWFVLMEFLGSIRVFANLRINSRIYIKFANFIKICECIFYFVSTIKDKYQNNKINFKKLEWFNSFS